MEGITKSTKREQKICFEYNNNKVLKCGLKIFKFGMLWYGIIFVSLDIVICDGPYGWTRYLEGLEIWRFGVME